MTPLPVYKGFQGAVEYDDGSLLVRLLHIEDAISATCQNAKEVLSTFHELVDDYIATCAELGDPPNKSFRGSFNIRIQPQLHRQAAMAAVATGVSLNTWVESAIEERLLRDR